MEEQSKLNISTVNLDGFVAPRSVAQMQMATVEPKKRGFVAPKPKPAPQEQAPKPEPKPEAKK